MLVDMGEPQVTAPAAGVKGEVRIQEPERWQQAVARRSAEARATVPHVELETVVSMDRAAEQARDLDCTPAALVLHACALALREVPLANAAYRDGKFELYSRINVGVVVAADEMYAIPTLFDADTMSPLQLSREVERLHARARAGQLASPELSGATFTFWDAGELGLTRAAPLVVPPQAAALAAGAIQPVLQIHDEIPVPTHPMTITLACDHRILYGSRAAEFLNRVKRQLEEGTPSP